jgi:hypothetical protein
MSSIAQFNNSKVSTFTNYQQNMGYKPVIKVNERYQVIKQHIYKWIKLLDNDILNLIPKRIFYINVIEDDYQNEPNWKAACYLESFIYSIAILKMKDINNNYELNSKYYYYIHYFIPNYKTSVQKKLKKIINNIKTIFNKTEFLELDNTTTYFNEIYVINIINKNRNINNGYDILKSDYSDICEHRYVLIETYHYSFFMDINRLSLYIYFDITPEYINYFCDKNIKKYVHMNEKIDKNRIIDSENLKNGFSCVYCMENKADCIFISCGHLVLCSECYNSENMKIEYKTQCPVCKIQSNTLQVKSG